MGAPVHGRFLLRCLRVLAVSLGPTSHPRELDHPGDRRASREQPARAPTADVTCACGARDLVYLQDFRLRRSRAAPFRRCRRQRQGEATGRVRAFISRSFLCVYGAWPVPLCACALSPRPVPAPLQEQATGQATGGTEGSTVCFSGFGALGPRGRGRHVPDVPGTCRFRVCSRSFVLDQHA